MLAVLQNPRFRLLLINVLFNDMAHVMYFMVHGWLTLTVTDSPFWVGAAFGMNGLGMVSFGVFGGVLADRIERRNLIIVGQLIQAVMAISLAILIFSDQIHLGQILGVAFANGVVAAVTMPASMTLTLDVVGRERLLSGISTNFAAASLMGIVAPLVGGAVVSTIDIGWAYVIIGGVLLVAAATLLALKGVPRVAERTSSPWRDLKDGVRYVLATPTVRTLLLMNLVASTLGWAHDSMLPVMARDVLGVGASGLGYMMAAASGGGTAATLLVSSLGEVKEKGRLMVAGLGGFGLFLILFAASPWFPLSMVLLALAYGSALAYEAVQNALLQTVVPDEMRGRVLSFESMTWGLSSASGFHTGAIATLLSAPIAIAIGGGAVLLSALGLGKRALRFQTLPAETATGD